MSKKALLVVSFGTSYEDTRRKTIDKIEEDLAISFPNHQIFRAFTSQMIINKLRKRDGLFISNPQEALEEIRSQGYEEVLIQPTHIINGSEFDGLVLDIVKVKNQFKEVKLGRPLLTSAKDYEKVVRAMESIFPKDFKDRIVLMMGHGSEHHSNSAYPNLDYVFKDKGYSNVHIATVEGYPDIDTVLQKLETSVSKDITLMPLMVVAGDHIKNDLVGDDEESWKSILLGKGYKVEANIVGMGEIKEIRNLFIEHAKEARLL